VSERLLLDTSLLVYADDLDAGEKNQVARRLLTEGLHHGQTLDGVRIENPFLATR
jgi:predicted nucleic acid-binding protein